MIFNSKVLQLTLIGWLLSGVAPQLPCSTEDTEECLLEDRSCLSGSSNDTAVECGPCRENHFEWEHVGGCLNISELTLEAFIEAHAPVYKDAVGEGGGASVVTDNTTLQERLELLRESAAFIAEHQRNSSSSSSSSSNSSGVELALTRFSADGPAEYAQRSGFKADHPLDDSAMQIPAASELVTSASPEELPQSLDWRNRNAVTEVKDQGRCGCCWAISMTGAIEGAAAANPDNDGYLQNLSWQQLISCNVNNLGCDGGSLVVALGYAWLNPFGGLTINNDYPFEDYQGTTTTTCDVTSKPLAVTISEPKIVLDFNLPTPFDTRVQLMKEALQVAPVSMTINSSCKTLSNYRKGILTDDGDCACSSTTCIDHAVLMVGYDDTTDPPSWIIKNSWGTAWGEDGFFYISQQAEGDWGLFGVTSSGVQAQLAYNMTAEVAEDKVKDPLPWWVWTLIGVAALVGCMCAGCLVRKLASGKEHQNAD